MCAANGMQSQHKDKAQPVSHRSSVLGGEKSLARQMMRFIKTIKEQINATAFVK